MLISNKLIDLDIRAVGKKDVIDHLVDLADKDNRLSDFEKFRTAVYKREEEVSTSLGYEVAVPHGKTNAVKEPFICFAKSTKGIYWNKQLVHLVFLIGVPENQKGNSYLNILASIARKIIDEDFRIKLLETNDKNEIIKIIDPTEN
ncbi:PTS sugar transporter subunit IIA [Liquorilactobacillus sicerae]|uniref:PTS sugar transporter subunit IIA n=1 Tax=Liquorilactobacillus sicerae TaxID=1416943 RepID=UPI002480B49D|nr:fructose PTS transporter subunit IIA [Liquorilactobacillus sicerae]